MSNLTPYVPRLVLDWARRTPDQRHLDLQGSLVFIDISGFTKMSERLARRGKVGAEEVSDAIDTCFSQLLQVSHEQGGGLLKFGGDALLLLFDGPDHPARASFAAWCMRDTLRRVGSLETSAGRVTLRMSCGIHSGELRFFLVGGSHRELIVTGRGSTRVAQMEAAADTGEILMSPETAEQLCQAAALGAFKEPGVLLKRPPQLEGPFRPEPAPTDVPADGFVPPVIAQSVRADVKEGEHRMVTVGFIRFSGVDDRLEAGDVEGVALGLEELVTVAQTAAEEEGIAFLASDIYLDGGKLILTAGAPLSTGNDEERMLRALTTIRDSHDFFPLRMGVYRGHVFSGEIGSPFRKTYTVMGDAVNMAARLMQRASDGQILTTEDVLAHSRTGFDARPLEAFLPKGKSQPVIPLAVGSAQSTRRDVKALDLPLIGRDEELKDLMSMLDASQSSSLVVQVIGEAGAGKSKLIMEALTRTEGRVVHVVCEQYQSSTPYWVIGRMLEDLLALEPGDAPSARGRSLREATEQTAPDLLPWLPLVAWLVDAEVPQTAEVRRLQESFRKTRLHSTVVSLFQRLLPAGVMSVDDAHWMDDASCQLLDLLVDEQRRLLLGRRYLDRGYEPGLPDKTVDLVLQPMSHEACKTMVRRLDTGRSFRPHDIDVLVEKAGGNPIFLIELTQSALRSGQVDSLPPTIETVIGSRIDRLASTDRNLLRYASVLGSSFDPTLLADAQIDLDPKAWTRLADFVSVVSANLIAFQSELYRQTAYEGLSYRTRRKLHSEVGNLMRRRSGTKNLPEILSTHFHLAEKHDLSWKYSRLAAARARSKWGFVEAGRFLERALQAADRIDVAKDEVEKAWEDLSTCLQVTGRYEEAQSALSRARKLSSGPLDQARIMAKMGDVQRIAGKHVGAIRSFNQGLRILEDVPAQEAGTTAVRLMLGKAIVDQERGRMKSSLKILHEAELTAERVHDEAGLGHVYHFLHLAYMKIGDPRSRAYRGRAIPIFRRSKDVIQLGHALNAVGSDYYYNGEWDKAREYYEKSRIVRERSGDILGQALSANNSAEILSDQGHLDEAMKMFEEALSIWVPARFEVGIAFASGNVGRLLTRKGDLSGGLARLEEALEGFERLGARAFVTEIRARIAENRTLAEDFGTAAKALDELAGPASEAGREAARLKAMIHRLRSAILAAHEGLEEAYGSLTQSVQAAREWNIRFEIAQSLLERARIAPHVGADPKPDERECARWFKKLGVVSVVELPISFSRPPIER